MISSLKFGIPWLTEMLTLQISRACQESDQIWSFSWDRGGHRLAFGFEFLLLMLSHLFLNLFSSLHSTLYTRLMIVMTNAEGSIGLISPYPLMTHPSNEPRLAWDRPRQVPAIWVSMAANVGCGPGDAISEKLKLVICIASRVESKHRKKSHL
jgi:hypothetical protein